MSGRPATPAESSPASARRRQAWGMAAIAVALVVAYVPVWQAGFVWDDDLHLTANPYVLSKGGLAQIWSSGAANYFPLTMTAYWALHALWGLDPLPYHLTTLALHVAGALLLWAVLRRLGVRGAWLGAALWALHPVQAESVAWISELKNTLSAIPYLGAAWFFLGWLEARGPETSPWPWSRATRLYTLAWLCGLFAILSKSSTVMLPVILGLCWWWREKAWRWREVRWLLPFLALSLAAAGWTIWEQKYNSHAIGAEWDQSLAQRGVIAGRVVWFYLGKLLWPYPLVFIYPRWTIDATQVLAWLPAVAAVAALGFAWLNRNGAGRAWFFAAGYFVVSLFPVLGFFDVYFFRFSFVGDHLQYLASMGVMAGIGAGAVTLATLPAFQRVSRTLLVGAVSVILAIFILLTWQQAHTYADAETLYRSILARNPACWLAHNNLAILLVGRGQRAEGLDHYREAVRHNPDYAEAHFNLGTAAMEDGRPVEAVEHFQIALRARRPDPAAYNSLGVALQQLRRAPEAVAYFEKAVALDPHLAPAHYNLANARFGARRYAEAIAHYETSLRLLPAQPAAENNLGVALLQLNRAADALPHFTAAVKLKPDHEDALLNLANTQADLGALAEAIPGYEALLRLKPDSAVAHNNLGNVLLRAGRAAEAVPRYETALRLIPDYVEAHNNLASALYTLGRGAEAIAHLEAAVRLNPNYTEARNNLARLRALLQTEHPPAK